MGCCFTPGLLARTIDNDASHDTMKSSEKLKVVVLQVEWSRDRKASSQKGLRCYWKSLGHHCPRVFLVVAGIRLQNGASPNQAEEIEIFGPAVPKQAMSKQAMSK